MTTVMPGRGGAGRDVLVADDSAVARKFLMRRLQRLGYRVHLAQSGEQAIEMLGQRSFAIADYEGHANPFVVCPGLVDRFIEAQ